MFEKLSVPTSAIVENMVRPWNPDSNPARRVLC